MGTQQEEPFREKAFSVVRGKEREEGRPRAAAEDSIGSCTKIQIWLFSGLATPHPPSPDTEDLLWTPGQWPQQNLEAWMKLCWSLLGYTLSHQQASTFGLTGQQGRPRRPQYKVLGWGEVETSCELWHQG